MARYELSSKTTACPKWAMKPHEMGHDIWKWAMKSPEMGHEAVWKWVMKSPESQ